MLNDQIDLATVDTAIWHAVKEITGSGDPSRYNNLLCYNNIASAMIYGFIKNRYRSEEDWDNVTASNKEWQELVLLGCVNYYKNNLKRSLKAPKCKKLP